MLTPTPSIRRRARNLFFMGIKIFFPIFKGHFPALLEDLIYIYIYI